MITWTSKLTEFCNGGGEQKKRDATKDAILGALEKSGNMEARDALLARWPGMI